MCILKFNNVCYNHGGKSILNNISLSVYNGDFLSIVGPSGSGKSTFLKLCNDLISPTEGSILFKGKDILSYSPTEVRKSISYSFQLPYLFSNTVLDNFAFPFYIRNQVIDIERIEELLSSFSMDKSMLKEEVKNLSGGEKQRISLIRNLLFEPEILLLDEVTSALDMDNILIVEGIIKILNQKGMTILWVTHNEGQSRKHSNKILTIEKGKVKSLEVLK